MKIRFTLALLLPVIFLQAQNITGIWRGTFVSGYGFFKQQYKYEVQINQLPNSSLQKGIQGVTYSYHTTVFYGKASLQGIYDSKNKSLTIKETKMLDLRIEDHSEPCLMTCYLDYRKDGKTEILEGNFTSVNANTNADCGSGYVYLERVPESDFKKEDFLIKKTKPSTNNNNTTQKKQKDNPPVAKQSKPNNTNPAPKKDVPPVIKKAQPNKTDSIVTQNQNKQTTPPPPPTKLNTQQLPVPDILKQRDNPLVKRIITNSPDILIQLYDNGEIDGDTITVYDNNRIIANRKGLTRQPVTLQITADAIDNVHEIVMVANNLGSIPPNTALMIVTTGGKRYELFISSDEKKNAKVVIEFQPPSSNSK